MASENIPHRHTPRCDAARVALGEARAEFIEARVVFVKAGATHREAPDAFSAAKAVYRGTLGVYADIQRICDKARAACPRKH